VYRRGLSGYLSPFPLKVIKYRKQET
jgi:hypothetical protein